MGTITTDVRGSTAGTKSKNSGADSLENEAIGLEVGVRIHGSQVAAVVLDTTEHVEPFEEDTTTMIVFPRGAVVKLRARVRTGHAVVLTHLATNQTALCRIIQVNSTANAANYVKLEFIQPVPGFWDAHFPSDNVAVIPVQEGQPPVSKQMENSAAKTVPVSHAAPTSASPITQPSPQADAARHEAKPAARESIKEIPKPSPAPSVSYGTSQDITTNEIVPLAAGPSKRTPATKEHKPEAAIVPPLLRAANLAPESPIFDSLSTGDEVFGKDVGLAAIEETDTQKSESEHKAIQIFAHSLDTSALIQSVEVPKRHTGIKVLLSIAAAMLIAAGAAFYVRQYRGNARQSASEAIPAVIPQESAPAPSSTLPTQSVEPVAPVTAEMPAPSTTETRTAGKHAVIPVAAVQDNITITPVHNNAKTIDSDAHPSIPTGLSNIYAGDLAARPQLKKHTSAPVQASVPTINGGPRELSSAPNLGLGSLGSGPSAALPTPPNPVEPKPVARGGVISAPRLLHSVRPVYPALAMSNRIEGDVQIQALIDQTGKVVSTKVVSGPILLRRAATDAVQQWRYSPATLDGKPTSMEYKVTVSFHLNQ